MASKIVRTVNVIPATRIKKEVLDDDDDCVSCKLCSKGFASEMALKNHAKMEHIEAWLSGEDIALKIEGKANPKKFNLAQLKEMRHRSESLLASTNNSLRSADVNYIVIKDESVPSDSRETKRAKVDRGDKEKTRKEKETTPITGPFECLQPSNFVSNGVCHQMFFSCCEYSAHHRDEHTRRRKGLRCQVCERPLAAERTAPFTCQTCGAGFNTSKELTDHCGTAHVKLKPYQCSVCNKRFTQQGGLQQHMRGHTGDRPFACTYCNKAFTQKSGLDQHLRIHTKFKPYRCVICNKTFCQSVHLQQHMRTHTNVAPFQCIVCQKRFKQSSHLNYHLKYHNPSNMTEEQRVKYAQLLQMVGKSGPSEPQAAPANGARQNEHGTAQNAFGTEQNAHGTLQNGDAIVERAHGNMQNVHDVRANGHVYVQNQDLIEDELELVEGQEFVEITEFLETSQKVDDSMQVYILSEDNGTLKDIDMCRY